MTTQLMTRGVVSLMPPRVIKRAHHLNPKGTRRHGKGPVPTPRNYPLTASKPYASILLNLEGDGVMTERLNDNALVVTVRRIWTAATAQGTRALAIQTDEAGTIAFSVTKEAAATLRLCLDQIEQGQ